MLLDDRISYILTTNSLKPEYHNTPLKDITLDMLTFNPSYPGVIFHFTVRGPAKVLRHERGTVSYAGQIFENQSKAAVALDDSWPTQPRSTYTLEARPG